MSLPKRTLAAMDERDGRRCVWHYEGACDPETLVPHHRSNRGMGGDRSKNVLSNLVWLDAETNGLVESDATYAESARKRGIKLSIHATPRNEPILYPDDAWYRLTDDGRRIPAGDRAVTRS